MRGKRESTPIIKQQKKSEITSKSDDTCFNDSGFKTSNLLSPLTESKITNQFSHNSEENNYIK